MSPLGHHRTPPRNTSDAETDIETTAIIGPPETPRAVRWCSTAQIPLRYFGLRPRTIQLDTPVTEVAVYAATTACLHYHASCRTCDILRAAHAVIYVLPARLAIIAASPAAFYPVAAMNGPPPLLSYVPSSLAVIVVIVHLLLLGAKAAAVHHRSRMSEEMWYRITTVDRNLRRP
jgi:hypothetical protein